MPVNLITQHHLLPVEKGGGPEHKVPTCKSCHKMVHAVFSNKELADRFTTVEQLRTAPEIERFVKFIRKQSIERAVTVEMSNGHPDRRRR